MRTGKEAWIQNKTKAIEKHMLNGDNEKAYSSLISLTKSSHQRATVVEDENSKVLTESEEILIL